jgi:hypothetical protein
MSKIISVLLVESDRRNVDEIMKAFPKGSCIVDSRHSLDDGVKSLIVGNFYDLVVANASNFEDEIDWHLIEAVLASVIYFVDWNQGSSLVNPRQKEAQLSTNRIFFEKMQGIKKDIVASLGSIAA